MLWKLLALWITVKGSTVLRATAAVCSRQRWEQRGGRKRLSRAVSVCLSAWPCPLLQHVSGNAETWSHLLSENRTPFHSPGSRWACLETCCDCEGTSVITCCFQASSREFGHFSFSTGGHCLAYINILYFPAVILGGKWEDTMKLLGQSSLNAPSSFHSSVFYLGYEYLSSQSFWLWWTSYTRILLAWCKFFAHAWFGGRALAVS